MKILVIRKNMHTNRKVRKELQRTIRNTLKYFESIGETSHQFAPYKSNLVTARMSGVCSAVEIMNRKRRNNRVLRV